MGTSEPDSFALQAKRIKEQLHLLLEHYAGSGPDDRMDEIKSALESIEIHLQELSASDIPGLAAVP